MCLTCGVQRVEGHILSRRLCSSSPASKRSLASCASFGKCVDEKHSTYTSPALSGRCAFGRSTVLTDIDLESWRRGIASKRNFDRHPAFLSYDQHTVQSQPRHQCCCCWPIRGGKSAGRGTPRRQERRRLDRRGQCKTV